MNNDNANKQDLLICHCSGTTETKINELLAKGVSTLEEIANATGATTGCGGCDYVLLELLAQHESDSKALITSSATLSKIE